MDSLFVVLLLLFFAQGLFGGKYPLLRAIVVLLVGGFCWALINALQ